MRFVANPEPHSHVYFCVYDREKKKIVRWGLSREIANANARDLNNKLDEDKCRNS